MIPPTRPFPRSNKEHNYNRHDGISSSVIPGSWRTRAHVPTDRARLFRRYFSRSGRKINRFPNCPADFRRGKWIALLLDTTARPRFISLCFVPALGRDKGFCVDLFKLRIGFDLYLHLVRHLFLCKKFIGLLVPPLAFPRLVQQGEITDGIYWNHYKTR